ncbi:MAG: chorismate synthase [Candidatus Eisenbacteria bacterium]|nr:chorismate synthase [Candidatus Eisenbacteria bacterium]
MGSQIGRMFRVMTWGESHGPALGCVIDGCPAGLPLSERDIQTALDRRRPGQSRLTTQRREKDRVQILSGVFNKKTLGSPISLLIQNEDHRSSDYKELKDIYRPSHADYTYELKYGIRDWRGGGRASARETAGRVAAGAVAERLLRQVTQCRILAYVQAVQNIRAERIPARLTRAVIDRTPVRCPDRADARQMIKLIDDAKMEGDSVGGIIELRVSNPPAGLGEPVFGKLEAELAKAMLSLPAVKGFEIGAGFAGTLLKGSEHNDPFTAKDGLIRTEKNDSGGVQGGISNGEEIVLRVAFKPTATIQKRQKTVDRQGRTRQISPGGRHDPCVLPRAVPLVEAMAALVLADLWLIHRGGSRI